VVKPSKYRKYKRDKKYLGYRDHETLEIIDFGVLL
jgi:hypothetical protein